jgi:predicted ribosome quality control (RQC) complex YloA/Tae2 family protein
MNRELTAFDLFYLIKELKDLEGAKLNKVYEQSDDKKDFLFLFHKTGKGKIMLRIKLPDFIYFTEHKQSFPDTPPGFCVFLRKYLINSKVKEIRQKGFERILEIIFDTKEGERILICELFSKGNMVLTDGTLKIKGLLESQSWESRKVRGGATYQYPPGTINTKEISFEEFEKIIAQSKKESIVKTLAIDLSLSGLYAEELCNRASTDKNSKTLTEDQTKKLYEKLKEFFSQEIKVHTLEEEVYPFNLETIENLEVSEKSFNQILDETITDKLSKKITKQQTKEKDTKEKKTNKIIEAQSKRLEQLKKSIEENQKKGEAIYENYQEIFSLLENIKNDKKKMSWDELKEKYSNNKLIKKFDEKNFKVIIDLK